jgi:hypothetical protein
MLKHLTRMDSTALKRLIAVCGRYNFWLPATMKVKGQTP